MLGGIEHADELPYEARLDEFAFALVSDKEQLLKRYDSGEARQRIVALISYFKDIHDLLQGRLPKPRREGGGGRGGSRKGIPGFIHFSSNPQVFFQHPEEDTGDEDVPSRDFTRVHFHSDALTPQANADLEALDIAPGEDLRPVMDLFPADKRPGGISSLWVARQAMESASQHHFWDKSQLTPVEVAALLDALEATSGPRNSSSENRLATEARLLLKTMLVLGCPMEEARTIRAISCSAFAEVIRTGQTLSTRLVLISDDGNRCAGFAQPAISPRYAAGPNEAFKQTANAAQNHLTLPDPTALGPTLLKHRYLINDDLEGPIFQRPTADLEVEIKKLLAGVNHRLDAQSRPRVTTTKVTCRLAAVLSRGGLDEVGVALVCSDQRYIAQARLHYTQHSTEHLTLAYTKAIRRLFTEAGRAINPRSKLDCFAPSAMVGARLIVRHQDLRQLITALGAEISSPPAHILAQ